MDYLKSKPALMWSAIAVVIVFLFLLGYTETTLVKVSAYQDTVKHLRKNNSELNRKLQSEKVVYVPEDDTDYDRAYNEGYEKGYDDGQENYFEDYDRSYGNE